MVLSPSQKAIAAIGKMDSTISYLIALTVANAPWPGPQELLHLPRLEFLGFKLSHIFPFYSHPSSSAFNILMVSLLPLCHFEKLEFSLPTSWGIFTCLTHELLTFSISCSRGNVQLISSMGLGKKLQNDGLRQSAEMFWYDLTMFWKLDNFLSKSRFQVGLETQRSCSWFLGASESII